MKYIKDFNNWLNENYPFFDDAPDALTESSTVNLLTPWAQIKYGADLQDDVSTLLFSFFDGGESKFKTKLKDFNEKYETSLNPPEDWTSLTMLDNPEKVYSDVGDFVSTYNELIK